MPYIYTYIGLAIGLQQSGGAGNGTFFGFLVIFARLVSLFSFHTYILKRIARRQIENKSY